MTVSDLESSSPFDRGAPAFDGRAGLPDEVVPDIVAAIGLLTEELGDGGLLDVGAGTGQLGLGLSRLPFDYLGFDSSAGMLAEFRNRNRAAGIDLDLIEADGNSRWPAKDQSVSVIFSSRTLHRLDPENVVREIFRVASPRGTTLITGAIDRPDDHPRSRMRRQMRSLLRQAGIEGRNREKNRRSLFIRCCHRGAELLDPVSAARWNAAFSPRQSIEDWRGKAGLAGRNLPEVTKNQVLFQLEQWAHAEFGDLDRPLNSAETYVLQGARTPSQEP